MANSSSNSDMCLLCRKGPPIDNSHIASKLFFKRMRQDSPIKSFRHSENPKLVLQDGFKKPYLCKHCENKRSVYEGWFCRNVYDPFRRSEKGPVEYGEELSLFLAFSHFMDRNYLGEMNEGLKDGFLDLSENLRSFCLGERRQSNPPCFYIALLHPIEDLERGYPPGVNGYWLDVARGWAYSGGAELGEQINSSVVKAPSVVSFATSAPLESIAETSLTDFRVKAQGALSLNANEDTLLYFAREVIINDIQAMVGRENERTPEQIAKIREELQADPNFEDSRRHKAWELDQELGRQLAAKKDPATTWNASIQCNHCQHPIDACVVQEDAPSTRQLFQCDCPRCGKVVEASLGIITMTDHCAFGRTRMIPVG